MVQMTYHPPADRDEGGASVIDLDHLARDAQDSLAGAAVDVLPELLRAGGSPGGARRRVLVGYNPNHGEVRSGEDDLPDGFEHWIVEQWRRQREERQGVIEARRLQHESSAWDPIIIPPSQPRRVSDAGMEVSDPIFREEAKVGRNDPCPCGSSQKYKRCCGRQ